MFMTIIKIIIIFITAFQPCSTQDEKAASLYLEDQIFFTKPNHNGNQSYSEITRYPNFPAL